jgi:hypothetical protein
MPVSPRRTGRGPQAELVGVPAVGQVSVWRRGPSPSVRSTSTAAPTSARTQGRWCNAARPPLVQQEQGNLRCPYGCSRRGGARWGLGAQLLHGGVLGTGGAAASVAAWRCRCWQPWPAGRHRGMAGRAPSRHGRPGAIALHGGDGGGEVLHLAGDHREPLAGQALIAWLMVSAPGCSDAAPTY